MSTSSYAKRRQLREARSNAGFAAVFFGGAAFVFFILASGTAWLFGSDGELFWWIFFTLFMVSVVCSGVALYNYVMTGDDLKDLKRR